MRASAASAKARTKGSPQWNVIVPWIITTGKQNNHNEYAQRTIQNHIKEKGLLSNYWVWSGGGN